MFLNDDIFVIKTNKEYVIYNKSSLDLFLINSKLANYIKKNKWINIFKAEILEKFWITTYKYLQKHKIISLLKYKNNDNYIKNNEFNLLRVLVTDICNLNCKYCKVENNISNTSWKFVQPKDFEKALELLLRNTNQIKTIHFTWWEPLIFKKEIISFIKNIEFKINNLNINHSKINIVIGTNWILLNKEFLDLLSAESKIFWKKIRFIVSIDWFKNHNDINRRFPNWTSSYDKVINTIKLLKKEKWPFWISMVIWSYNIDSLSDIVEYYYSFKPESFWINLIKPPKAWIIKYKYRLAPDEYASKIFDLHKKFRNKWIYFELINRKLKNFVEKKFRYSDCWALNRTTINIDCNWNLSPCKSSLIMQKSFTKDINLYDKLLDKDWDRKDMYNKKICSICPAISICWWWCNYNKNNLNSKNEVDEDNCSYSKKFFELMIDDCIKLSDKKNYNFIRKITSRERNRLIWNIKYSNNSLSRSIWHDT